jgi:3-phenylpropionate/trans-cinnamate dioxygenase ferredoxin subunit
LTTRINPREPRFNDEAPFNFEHWFASDDLIRRRFGKIKLFPANRFKGAPSIQPRADVACSRIVRLKLPEVPTTAEEVVLCSSDTLRDGDKVAVDGPNLQLLLIRTSAGVKAYDRRCPHRGIDLVDGHLDANVLFCPGHGVAFSLADGTSKCAAFTLRAAEVAERDGQIFLRRRKAAVADAAVPEQIAR